MKMFLLLCKVVPVSGGPQDSFAGGRGVVWVWTDSKDRVDGIAEDLLLELGWLIDERNGIHEIDLDTVKNDSINVAHCLKAQRHGAAAAVKCF
jgi:hypothetical protein